jgi:hypothetical protein
MYLVLLVFGAVLTIAGIVLGAAGISIHDHTFDASLVTPGVVAAAGGLILIGLGFALRVLQRIELALATARPMPRATRLGETAVASEASAEPGRIPFPPKRDGRSQPGRAAASPTPAELPDAKSPQVSQLKLPTLARLDSALVAQETDVSPLSKASGRVDEAVGEIQNGRAARRSNGIGAAKVAPRLGMDTRSSPAVERPNGPAFDSLWPKSPRPARATQAPSLPIAAPPPVEPAPSDEAALDAPVASDHDEAQVSILKSGVVDGMAYTLYSDGSIEADLPQGTIRFGSITELRNHIEQRPPGAVLS